MDDLYNDNFEFQDSEFNDDFENRDLGAFGDSDSRLFDLESRIKNFSDYKSEDLSQNMSTKTISGSTTHIKSSTSLSKYDVTFGFVLKEFQEKYDSLDIDNLKNLGHELIKLGNLSNRDVSKIYDFVKSHISSCSEILAEEYKHKAFSSFKDCENFDDLLIANKNLTFFDSYSRSAGLNVRDEVTTIRTKFFNSFIKRKLENAFYFAEFAEEEKMQFELDNARAVMDMTGKYDNKSIIVIQDLCYKEGLKDSLCKAEEAALKDDVLEMREHFSKIKSYGNLLNVPVRNEIKRIDYLRNKKIVDESLEQAFYCYEKGEFRLGISFLTKACDRARLIDAVRDVNRKADIIRYVR